MNIKVYVLMINENALDGFPYKQNILVFCDKGSCLKWLAEETKRRENNGYRLVPPDEDGLDNWRFVKQERWGNMVTEMDGMYKEVMK